jgi:2'-5' RNA ligase
VRLFAAVWPPDEVLDHLDLALGAVRRTLPLDGTGPVRWSARETWHLTCAFYGEVPDGRVPEMVSALAAATATAVPYRLRLSGAGVFAHRTLWVGVGGDTAAQQTLARAAVSAGEGVGARSDDRPRDRAHLTIGRVRAEGAPWRGGARGRGRNSARPDGDGRRTGRGAAGPLPFDPESLVGALAVYQGPEWTVDSLRLVASRPGEGRGGGPLYTAIEELAFGGAPPPVAPWAP